jgi:hypothetical protein
MRKLIVFLFVLTIATGAVIAETLIEQIDRMHEEEQHQENYALIKGAIDSANGNVEKAELYWRLARTVLEIGDLLKQDGTDESEILDTFSEGEGYADRSIELNPNSHHGYYWKSANIGRWGETKGVLNSLFKAKSMRSILSEALSINPEHADSYYVLGIMHRKVPGRPVSFGSADKAVSLGRKAVDAQRREFETGEAIEIKLSYFVELSRSLYERDWSASKRRKSHGDKEESFAKERDVLKKGFFYEGTLSIPNVSDRQEAIEMIEWAISEYRSKPTLKNTERVKFEEALVDLADWTD